MRVILFCFFILSTFSFSLNSQSTISSTSILASAQRDPNVVLHQQQLHFISQTNQNLPFAEQISFRTETDRFELYRQEYLWRLNVNGLNEIRRQKELNEANYTAEQILQKLSFHDALKERYEVIAAYHYLQLHQDLQEDLILVHEDRINVLKKMAILQADAEVDELIKSEFDRDELMSEILQAGFQAEAYKNKISGWITDIENKWDLDTSGFIRVSQIENMVNTLPLSITDNPNVAEKLSEVEVIEREYHLEKASASQMLDFFQVRYADRLDEIFSREISLGLAINLPFKGSSRPKTGELLIEKNYADLELKLYLEELTKMINDARSQINALGEQYRMTLQQWNDSQARFTLEQTSGKQEVSPFTMLKAREVQIQREGILLEIEEEMILHYINILDWTGMLSSTPPINYLSATLEGY